MGEWIGVAIALLSSCLGGTAAAITRYLVGGAGPIALAIPRRGIGFVCLLPAALQLTLRKTLGVGEPITPNLVVGLIAVFAGIWIATPGSRKPNAAALRPVAGLSNCRLFSG